MKSGLDDKITNKIFSLINQIQQDNETSGNSPHH
jgi:hypothetical protein